MTAARLVIASAAKLVRQLLDCFVALLLAMTAYARGACKIQDKIQGPSSISLKSRNKVRKCFPNNREYQEASLIPHNNLALAVLAKAPSPAFPGDEKTRRDGRVQMQSSTISNL
jgi:hypothetical protein